MACQISIYTATEYIERLSYWYKSRNSIMRKSDLLGFLGDPNLKFGRWTQQHLLNDLLWPVRIALWFQIHTTCSKSTLPDTCSHLFHCEVAWIYFPRLCAKGLTLPIIPMLHSIGAFIYSLINLQRCFTALVHLFIHWSYFRDASQHWCIHLFIDQSSEMRHSIGAFIYSLINLQRCFTALVHSLIDQTSEMLRTALLHSDDRRSGNLDCRRMPTVIQPVIISKSNECAFPTEELLHAVVPFTSASSTTPARCSTSYFCKHYNSYKQ
jgi:hypothetical protein